MTRRCSVIRMPFSVQSSSRVGCGSLATMLSRRSGTSAKLPRHDEGAARLLPALRIVACPAPAFAKFDAAIKADRGDIGVLDLEMDASRTLTIEMAERVPQQRLADSAAAT